MVWNIREEQQVTEDGHLTDALKGKDGDKEQRTMTKKQVIQ